MANNHETKKPIPELRLRLTHLRPVDPLRTPEEWTDIEESRSTFRQLGEEVLAEAKAKEEAEAKDRTKKA